jgi:DNA-binding response OmpR family regulator
MSLVLLVEDDHRVRAAMLRALRRQGHVVHPVGTAQEALRTVSETHVDIVVLDLGLPDVDGSDALRMIRGLSDVPVIVSAARDDERSAISLLNAGADDYVVKPFSAEHIGARITAVMRRNRPSAAPPDGPIAVGQLRIDVQRR